MKKAFRKYLFSLTILLVGGLVNHLYAEAQGSIDEGNAYYIGSQHLDHTSVGSPQIEFGKNFFVEITDVEEQEEKEEDLSCYDTDVRFGSYFTTFFYASVSGPQFRELQINLGFSEPSSVTAPLKRHVRFQVFRI